MCFPCELHQGGLEQVLGFIFPGKQGKRIIVHEDNEGAIHLANHPLGSAQPKLIIVRHHFIRNESREGRIANTHMGSENQCADIMAKPLPQEVLEKHSRYIVGVYYPHLTTLVGVRR